MRPDDTPGDDMAFAIMAVLVMVIVVCLLAIPAWSYIP